MMEDDTILPPISAAFSTEFGWEKYVENQHLIPSIRSLRNPP